MGDENRILIGLGDKPVQLETRYANRHGLITGATGTGKTAAFKMSDDEGYLLLDLKDLRARKSRGAYKRGRRNP